MFSLVRALPSTACAEADVSFLSGFIDITARSDSSRAFASGVRPSAFPDRPRLARNTPVGPRFSCMQSLSAPGVCDYVGQPGLPDLSSSTRKHRLISLKSPAKVNQSSPGTDGNGDTKSLNNLLARCTFLYGRVRVHSDAAVTLFGHCHRDCDELTRLGVKHSGFLTGSVQGLAPIRRQTTEEMPAARCLHLRFQQPFRPSAACRLSSASWGTILCRRPTHLPFSAWGTQMKCRQEKAAIQLPHS